MARTNRSFFERNLTGPKVREALESMGGDLEQFEKAYADTRRSVGPRPFTTEQVTAFRAFTTEGRNIERLASDLGVKVTAARAFVARAVEAGLI